MERIEIANLITEYRYEFSGRIPSQRREDEQEEFVALVKTFHRRFKDHPIQELRYAFEQHLKHSNGFFPKTGELLQYFRSTEHPDDIPSEAETQAMIEERERLIAEAKAKQTPEHMERMKRHHDKIAGILGLKNADQNTTDAVPTNREYRIDFNVDEPDTY